MGRDESSLDEISSQGTQSFCMPFCLYAAIVFAIVLSTTLIILGSTMPIMTLVIIRNIHVYIYTITSFLPGVTDDAITEHVAEAIQGMMHQQSRRIICSSP